MNPSSDSFLHFTSGMDILEFILEDGFRVSPCDEVFDFKDPDTGEGGIAAFSVPMLCFCDIPIPAIASHAEFYCTNKKGETNFFGIGMTREWGLRIGLNPVAYISPQSNSFTSNEWEKLLFAQTLKFFLKYPDDVAPKRYPYRRASMFCVVPTGDGGGIGNPYPRRIVFDKVTQGNYYRLNNFNNPDDGQIHPFLNYFDIIPNHNFYNEREWRFVEPYQQRVDNFESKILDKYAVKQLEENEGFVQDEHFPDRAFQSYRRLKHEYLQQYDYQFKHFTIDDISVIIVNEEGDKEKILKKIESLKTFGGNKVNEDILKKIPGLMMTYHELKEKEDI